MGTDDNYGRIELDRNLLDRIHREAKEGKVPFPDAGRSVPLGDRFIQHRFKNLEELAKHAAKLYEIQAVNEHYNRMKKTQGGGARKRKSKRRSKKRKSKKRKSKKSKRRS
jgi:predicted amidophosphoribosyltransferase